MNVGRFILMLTFENVMCEQIFEVFIITSSSMAPFEAICKACDFLNLKLLPNFSNYYNSTL